ncbi:probable ATP-dependent RNA helicase DDX31 isoform X3 [Falco peregrinus]|uniref:probable ATP-dependent RNA helicase DDX31 isoform X3 n=1 Tax=Falco peregrinus TaxID=8954 RepID=UPI0024786672|nr:probable ATP-dependent RNA helicase DDX31 isoform X3 [Falco peregrinus]
MTISCPPLCTSLSCSSTAMLRAVLTDTRWSSDQASGSSPLTPCCSRTAGSRRTAVSRNPALGAAAAASSTSESSPSGGSSSPAASEGLPPRSAAAILPPPLGPLGPPRACAAAAPKPPAAPAGLPRRCLRRPAGPAPRPEGSGPPLAGSLQRGPRANSRARARGPLRLPSALTGWARPEGRPRGPAGGGGGAMAAAGPLLLNLRSAPRGRGPAAASRQSTTLKRKLQSPHGNPPLKRKCKPSVSAFQKCPVEADIREKESSSQKSLPKKQLTDKRNKSQKSKPSIKTSSLFKNNPEIPEVHRKAVRQVQENVFTKDSFSQLDLHPHLISTINTVLKISSMTSVQKQTIPVLLQGKDALVRSQTGSGKTLAYGIPLVQSLQGMESKIKRSDGPYALILVPTREPFAWIVPGVLMGGEKRKSEKARLRKGINILISTPGRLVDHIKSTECIHFRRTQWLIIDEADRILDLGFEKDVAVILNALNAGRDTRQNVLLSATLTEGVTRLADISLNDPISISIADEIQKAFQPASQIERQASSSSNCMEQENFAVPEKLKQYVMMVPSKLRLVTLAAFILEKCKFEKHHKMIIFFSSCEQVEFYHELLLKVLSGGLKLEQSERSSVSSAHLQFLRLHGNMEQEERTEVFQEFLKSKTGILLCTDVAARGLDLPQVTWIVQYNAPASPAEYIHRIGRTARIGCHGNSLLVLAPSEAEYVSLLASHKINVSEMKMEKVLLSLMKDDRFKLHRPRSKKSCGTDPQEVRERATVLQTKFENYVHSSEGTVRWAKKALQSFLCAYTTYPRNLKHIFHIKSLHLGHVAKSFGLRDAPQNLTALPTAGSKKKTKPGRKRSDLLKKTHGKHHLAEILRSEYSSGMDTGVSKVKKKKKQRKPGNQQIPA